MLSPLLLGFKLLVEVFIFGDILECLRGVSRVRAAFFGGSVALPLQVTIVISIRGSASELLIAVIALYDVLRRRRR